MPGLGSIIGGALGALGSYFGGKEEARGYDRAAEAQLEMYRQTREDLQPFVEAGSQALNPLVDFVLGSESKFGPGHPAFDAVTDLYAAKKKGFSGERARRLSEVYGETFRPMRMNELSGLVNMAQNAAAGQGSAAMNAGRTIASLRGAQGAARADMYAGMGNSFASLPWSDIFGG